VANKVTGTIEVTKVQGSIVTTKVMGKVVPSVVTGSLSVSTVKGSVLIIKDDAKVTFRELNGLSDVTITVNDIELTTNANGKASLRLPKYDSFDYVAEKSGYADTESTVIIAGKDVTETFTMTPSTSDIVFHVTDSADVDLEGVIVTVDGNDYETNADGNTEVVALESGETFDIIFIYRNVEDTDSIEVSGDQTKELQFDYLEAIMNYDVTVEAAGGAIINISSFFSRMNFVNDEVKTAGGSWNNIKMYCNLYGGVIQAGGYISKIFDLISSTNDLIQTTGVYQPTNTFNFGGNDWIKSIDRTFEKAITVWIWVKLSDLNTSDGQWFIGRRNNTNPMNFDFVEQNEKIYIGIADGNGNNWKSKTAGSIMSINTYALFGLATTGLSGDSVILYFNGTTDNHTLVGDRQVNNYATKLSTRGWQEGVGEIQNGYIAEWGIYEGKLPLSFFTSIKNLGAPS
jgi:hypothetical protein